MNDEPTAVSCKKRLRLVDERPIKSISSTSRSLMTASSVMPWLESGVRDHVQGPNVEIVAASSPSSKDDIVISLQRLSIDGGGGSLKGMVLLVVQQHGAEPIVARGHDTAMNLASADGELRSLLNSSLHNALQLAVPAITACPNTAAKHKP